MKKWFFFIILCLNLIAARAEQREQVLKVTNWVDFIDERLIEEFEQWYAQTTGEKVRVDYSTYTSPDSIYSNVNLKHADYDVLCMPEFLVERLFRHDLLQPLDTTHFQKTQTPMWVHNTSAYLDNAIQTFGEYSGRRVKDYAVPYQWGNTGVVYNTEYVDRSDVESWDFLFNPKYKGKVRVKDAFSDLYTILVLYYHYENIRSGRMSRNLVASSLTEENLKAVKQLLQQMRSQLAGWEFDLGRNLMASGQDWLAVTWHGEALWAINRAKSGVNLDFVVPKEGTDLWIDCWVVPAYAKNTKAASYWINFLCRNDNALRCMKACGWSTSAIATPEMLEAMTDHKRKESTDLSYFFGPIGREARLNPILYPDTSVIARMALMRDVGDRQELVRNMWVDMKNTFVRQQLYKKLVLWGGVAVLVLAIAGFVRFRQRRRRAAAIFLFCLVSAMAMAQGANNTGTYYKYAHGRKGADLKTALYKIIKDPNVVTYGNGLKMGYIKTDTRADGYLRDFYSNITKYEPGSDMAAGEYEGFNYNREHTVCQSWFLSQSPMYSDIVMVIPTDGYINSRRNNNPFGEVTSKADNVKTSANGYSKWGAPREGLGQPAEVTTVFEPNDEVKGDIARIYFYMATCYQDRATTFTNGTGQYVFNAEGTSYQPLQPWVLNMMMRWSENDPVDDVERARNAAVFEVQGNRNPFVDYPGLEDYVWGTKTEELFSYDGTEATGPFIEDDEPAVSGTIMLNNTFFGVDWTGQRPSGGVTQMKGKQGGITITYAKGSSGQNMFCNDKCIRLYKYNEFTIAVSNNEMVEVEFNVTANANNKVFWASEGEIIGYKWTGKANEVLFRVDDGNGSIQVASVTIGLAVDTGIDFAVSPSVSTWADSAIYNLLGQKVDNPKPGLYIKNGKKIIIR